MRRIHARGLVAALEEEQVIEAAVAEQAVENGDAAARVVDPVEQLDNAESLETELLEVQEVEAEGVEQEAQVEEAIEVSEALDEYQEALESIGKQGGLDRNGAMILQIGLEQLCARVGIEPTAMAFPSMESFGGATSRIHSTKVAMESVKETAKKVWEAIIAGIKRAGEWLKNFWKTLTDSNHRLKARADKVKAAAASVKGEAQGELENTSLADKLHRNGKVEKNFGHDFNEFTKFCETMAGKVVPGVVKHAEVVVDLTVKGLSTNDGEIAFKASDIKSAYSGLQLTASDEEVPEGVEALKSQQLPGGKALLVQLPTVDGNSGAQAFAKSKTSVGLFKPATAKATNNKMPVLTVNEITGIADNVVKVSSAIESLRKLEAEFDKFVKRMHAGAIAAQKENEHKAANEGKEPNRVKMPMIAAKAIFTSLTTRVINLPANFGSYALSTSKAAMDYSELSLKAYK